MESYRFSIVIEENSWGFRAHCPELDGCCAQCGSYEETIERVKKNILRVLEEKLRAGEEIPQPFTPCSMDLEIQYSLN
ncbi:MAG: type II toxin-antitoxin system HicB family antitoxin [Nitrospirota bacterium]|jgi:predicted RNase H-like HicB family nuclease